MNNDDNTFSGHSTSGFPEYQPGMRIGAYELLELLGQGGMGAVWKANDTQGGRPVALKLLPREFRGSKDAMAQVRSSFQLSHSLTHQHLCKVLALHDEPKHGPFLVMDFVPGITLSEYRRRFSGGRVPLDQVVSILRCVATALDYAHQSVIQTPDGERNGVLHRDVKPQNIMLCLKGDAIAGVSLIDIGLAAEIRSTATRFTQARVDTRGTRPYMSPEQLSGKRSQWDGRTDQYSLGVVAYELLSGHPPFEADDDAVLMHAIANVKHDPIDGVPLPVNAALERALAKAREDRFPSCSEFVLALQSSVACAPKAWPRLDVQRVLRQWHSLAESGSNSYSPYLLVVRETQLDYWQQDAVGDETVKFLLAESAEDEERLKLLTRLAQEGLPLAQWRMGEEYTSSQDSPNYALGIQLLEKAAKQDLRIALYKLAEECWMNESLRRSEWGERTSADLARKGLLVAMGSRGRSQLMQADLENSLKQLPEHRIRWMTQEAIDFLQKSARAGDSMSATTLSSLFARGRQVPMNSTESDYWGKMAKTNLIAGMHCSPEFYGIKLLLNAGYKSTYIAPASS